MMVAGCWLVNIESQKGGKALKEKTQDSGHSELVG